jgi:hypothetical protein
MLAALTCGVPQNADLQSPLQPGEFEVAKVVPG